MENKSYKHFNLNNFVLVKLNDVGYQKMFEINNHYHNFAPTLYDYKTIEDLKSETNKNGYIKFQMWELMHIFGENMWNGSLIPFDMNILIDETYLEYPNVDL